MNEFKYKFEDGVYKYVEIIHRFDEEPREDVILTCEKIALCYCSEDMLLLKHGDVKKVVSWATETRRKYVVSGLTALAISIKVLEIPIGFDIEELNKCIENASYIETMLKKFETN